MSRRARDKPPSPSVGGDQMPLLAVRPQRHPSFLTASFEARHAINGAGEDAAAVSGAVERLLAQLQGLATCLSGMAGTGLLNLDVRATDLQTSTRLVDGSWRSQTCVTRHPPRACMLVRVAPEVCSALMQALVIFSAIEVDSEGELVEFRELAGMLHADWPDMGEFAAPMRRAWALESATSSPTGAMDRLARATTERLRGAARAAGGGGEAECGSALEYAHRALKRVSESEYVVVDR